jgi:uncharacterized BrkB/YihY/UPF0761 family membrane protein
VVLVVLAGSGRASLVLWPAALAATWLICASLYRLCPRSGIPWRAAAVGALPAALGLQAVPTLAAVYLEAVAGRTPVRIFLVLAGVLITSYLSSLSLLLGSAVACRRAGSA